MRKRCFGEPPPPPPLEETAGGKKAKVSVRESSNTVVVNVLPPPPRHNIVVVKRKFPGPAGLLLDNAAEDDELLPLCVSQATYSFFEKHGPWLHMLQEYKDLVDVLDIKWIKTEFKRRQIQRVPFLAAAVETTRRSDDGCNNLGVMLKDRSGEIRASIINSLCESYVDCFVVGAVLVLKQCAVMDVGRSGNSGRSSLLLNVTPNNLVKIIYLKKNDNSGDEIVTTVLVQMQQRQQELEQLKRENLEVMFGLKVKPDRRSSEVAGAPPPDEASCSLRREEDAWRALFEVTEEAAVAAATAPIAQHVNDDDKETTMTRRSSNNNHLFQDEDDDIDLDCFFQDF